MTGSDTHAKALERLEAAASRVGLAAVLMTLFILGLIGGLLVHAQSYKRTQEQVILYEKHMRAGYIVLNEVKSLSLIAQQATTQGSIADWQKASFQRSLDMLGDTSNSFVREVTDHPELSAGETAIAALHHAQAVAKEVVQSDFAQIAQAYAQLSALSEALREDLTPTLADLRIMTSQAQTRQDWLHRVQQQVVFGVLILLVFLSGVACVLLRREIAGRKAQAAAEARIAFLAYSDPLTELPNRGHFQEHLQGLLDDPAQAVSLGLIDLDKFKAINDTYGHAAGDAVLCRMAEILAKIATKYGAFAARLAGDEFAIVFKSDKMATLVAAAQELIEEVAIPITVKGEVLQFGLSIGFASATWIGNGVCRSVDGLSRLADFALYASKEGGRNRYTMFDAALESKFHQRRALLEDLPKAIETGEMEIELQPQVHFPSGDITGFEALVRWRRPGDPVKTDEFIPVAEESGLIVEIDAFALNAATREIAAWNLAHGTCFRISVNLSTVNFKSDRILETVQTALHCSGLDPNLLTLEITEHVEMGDWEQARKIIAALRDLGCEIAIDDFGTGFSSLAYLRAIQADELKVASSLINEIEHSSQAQSMLASVFDIAHNLGLAVTVEGVETAEQAAVICDMGPVTIQGNFYAPPQPPRVALYNCMPVPNGPKRRFG